MLRLAAVLAVLPLLAGPAPQSMETRDYDLRILVRLIEPPPLGLNVQQDVDRDSEEEVCPYDDVENTIRGLFPDKVWEEDQAGLSFEEGILTVTHRAAVQDVVAAAVRHLRHAAARPIRIDAQLLEMAPADYAAWRGSEAGPVLAEAQVKALSVALAEGRAQIVKEFSSRIAEGQPDVLQDLEQRTYVSDLEPQISEGSFLEDPVIGVMQVGDAWTLTAAGLPGRDEVRLDFAMRRLDLLGEEEFQPVDKGPALVLPRGRRQEHHQTLVAPTGRVVLAAAWQLEGKSRLLTVRARVQPAGDCGPVTGPSGIVLSAFPLPSILYPIPSRRAPDVRIEFGGGLTIPAQTKQEDEERDLRAEAMLERVREAIGGWDLAGSAFTTAESRIAVVRHDKDRTAAAARHLAKAVEPHFKMVTVEARVLSLDGMGLARLKSSEPPPVEVVRDPAMTIAAAEFTLLEGQAGYVADLGVRTFVSDFDAQVAKESSAPDPVVSEVMDGLEVEARAQSAEAGRLSLNLKAWLAQIELTPRTLRRADKAELHAHSMRRQEFRLPVSMSVKEGEWTVAGLTTRKKGADTVHVALVVRATRGK